MWEAVFGADLPLPLKFVIAFVLVLGLIGGAAYLVRRFGAGALNAAALRGRQPRLAVIDAAQVDNRRRLVLIRRDNVEHLIMIGGPTDLVVEPNIVRASPAASTRETPPARVAITEALPRPVPLAEGSMWPLQPEPAPRPARAPADESIDWPEASEPIARPEPAARAEPPARAEPAARTEPAARQEPLARPEPAVRPEPAARTQNSNRLVGLAADLSRNFEPDLPPSPPAAPRRSAEQRRPAPTPAISPSDDQKLADMAHRALQRPRQAAEPAPAEPMMPREVPQIEPKVARTESKPAAKPAFDSLEQEMASLLGRPSGKT